MTYALAPPGKYSFLNVRNLLKFIQIFIAYKVYRIFFPRKIIDIRGKWILITGAAGGLGAEVSKQCAAKGANLILWDIFADGLKKLETEIRISYPDCKIRTQVANLAVRDRVYDACDTLLQDILPDVVVNNAGIISGGSSFVGSDDNRNELSFSVNVFSHFWITKKFLPRFIERGSGHFVNVASMASFVAAPGMVDYAASKFAARGFAQGLNAELRLMGVTSKVAITCFCPSHIDTKLFQGFSITGNLVMSPEYVGARLVESIESQQELVVLPRYLISSLSLISFLQMLGFHGIPNLDSESPMAKWKPEQANLVFEKISKV